MQVAKWGNSLAVRLPASLVKVLDLKEGDDIEIVATSARRLEVSVDPERENALKRLREIRREAPKDFRLDRNELHER